jgi:hypothetical protein
LHYRRTVTEDALVVFFPAGGGKPESLAKTDPGKYLETFNKWYRLVGEAESVILVDGVVSFTKDDFPGVKYVTAKSPSCDIGWM